MNILLAQIQVVDVAWDDSLGGRDFDYELVKLFIKDVAAKTGQQISQKENPKAYNKLFKEAQKAKEILSANQDVRASVCH
ncbi:MAG: Hsp70 family protein [Actinobacteria bacterium]|nr:Hsp70 family protein [Actinomycetota bacterium]